MMCDDESPLPRYGLARSLADDCQVHRSESMAPPFVLRARFESPSVAVISGPKNWTVTIERNFNFFISSRLFSEASEYFAKARLSRAERLLSEKNQV